ncbi:MAG TPA: N-acetyltransferase [bacterium]|nr:N-acetyltransferase [bacterium]
MTTTELLALYDIEERRQVSIPGFRREETAQLVRMVDEAGAHAYIAWSDLKADTAEMAIEREMAHFSGLGLEFEWKTYSHDKPADLVERLRTHGFAVEEDEAIMALDLSATDEIHRADPAIRILRIDDPRDLGDYDIVEKKVWGDDTKQFMDYLSMSLRDYPDYQSIYVAYVAAEPVCAARINFSLGSSFASLWGGSTVKEFRGRGIYSAMLELRLKEARDRGYSFVTIDASPMSRPIAEKRGFRLLAMSNPCVFKPNQGG